MSEHSHAITKIIKKARPLDLTAKGYSQAGERFDKSRTGIKCSQTFRESLINTISE